MERSAKREVSATLVPNLQADWEAFLREWCDLGDLRSMAFDLGAEFTVFSHRMPRGFSRALMRFLGHTRGLGLLADQIEARWPDADVPELPLDLATGLPRLKAEVALPVDWGEVGVSELQDRLATAFGVASDEVAWVGAAGDKARLLVSVPDVGRGIPKFFRLPNGRFAGGPVHPFADLDPVVQERWAAVACDWPPRLRGDRLYPMIAWDDASTLGRKRPGLWVALGLMLALVVVLVGYDQLLPWATEVHARLQGVWSDLVREGTLWLQFLASIALSLLALSWATALLFGLLAATLYLLPTLIHLLATVRPGASRLPRLRDSLRAAFDRHDRLFGTALNLVASGLALLAFARITRQPLDYWDLGIQLGIALALELIVLGILLAPVTARSAATKQSPPPSEEPLSS